jgi:LmbE family N-acetylglucosaminyl deacetylase
LAPAHLLIPFRYDRHPDHLAITRVVRQLEASWPSGPEVIEYFVYARTRLLWRGDLRAYLRPERLLTVHPGRAADLKRQALECYRTQVTRYFSWQERPILTPNLLDRNCASREVFLRSHRAEQDSELFTAPLWWIRTAHALEPRLKHWKDRAAASLSSPVGSRGRSLG